MSLKRITAIIITLILLVQLTACKSNSSTDTVNSLNTSIEESLDNSSVNDSSWQNTVDDEISDDNLPSNSESQDDVNNESSDDNTSSDDTQIPDDTKQDTEKDETPTDDTPVVQCNHGTVDPYQNVSKTEFYAEYTPACCNLDATYRSKHGLLSGSLEVPGQYAIDATNQPKQNNKFVRNTSTIYIDDGNTYVVIDSTGSEVMRIHKAGGYITLEEVAAYMYAFGGDGTIPANYISKKKGKPNSSIWGEYLRVNHSYFIGDTDKYPYEPELPDISGCGGDLQYYEMDIGTTGTTTPGYAPEPYIEGNSINRGAARIVYARQDLNKNGIYETNEVYVFYTHNHYNDFREYLNYYGGWGEMFGNVTGGGEYSSKYNANPSPYVPTAYADFKKIINS